MTLRFNRYYKVLGTLQAAHYDHQSCSNLLILCSMTGRKKKKAGMKRETENPRGPSPLGLSFYEKKVFLKIPFPTSLYCGPKQNLVRVSMCPKPISGKEWVGFVKNKQLGHSCQRTCTCNSGWAVPGPRLTSTSVPSILPASPPSCQHPSLGSLSVLHHETSSFTELVTIRIACVSPFKNAIISTLKIMLKTPFTTLLSRKKKGSLKWRTC